MAEDVAADSIIGLIVLVSVMALGVAIWLAVKLVELFVRVISRSYENMALRATGALFALLLVITICTTGQIALINWLTGLSLLALICVAVVLDVEGRTAKPKPVDLQSVMTNPWWND